MDDSFERMIEALVSDGQFSDRRRDYIMCQQADRYGVDRHTAAVLINRVLRRAGLEQWIVQESQYPKGVSFGVSSNNVNSELERLVDAIVADGQVTDKERRVLHMTADRLGVDRDEADVWLDAALARGSGGPVRTSSTPGGDVTVENCGKCGAAIEPIMSNCMFCGAPTRSRDHDSMSDEQLIMRASEWIGKISDGIVHLEAPNANHFTGKGIKALNKGEIAGIAAQYLNVLHIRARRNTVIAPMVASLDSQYAKNKRSMPKNYKMLLGAGVLMILMLVASEMNLNSHERKINNAVATLSSLEVRIQDAVTSHDFAAARTLVVQLDWPNAEGHAETDEIWSNKHAEKRRAYLETIARLEQELQRGQ